MLFQTALTVIARDEAPRIERLLRSVTPHVDAMLVLDTGSTDGTPELAAACGARVHHLAWPDDFALARNAALDLAAADWHVVLDADEWLIDGGAVLAQLRHLPPDFVGAVALEDHFDGGCARHWLSRILPGRVRYRGRIHEQPVHALPVRRLDIRIGHDGYQPERLQAKQGRNRALLQADLAEHPGDPYLWHQLGKDCAVYDDHAGAESAWAQAATIGDRGDTWWLDLVVRRLYSLKKLKRHAEALDWADAQMLRCEHMPDFHFALGDLLLDLAADHPEQAAEALPMMEAAWRRCLEIGERPELCGSVAGRGSHLAAHNLALLLDGTGRPDEAAALRGQYASR